MFGVKIIIVRIIATITIKRLLKIKSYNKQIVITNKEKINFEV